MRRLLHIFLLTLSMVLAVLATAFHRPIRAFDHLHRYAYTEFPLGNFTFLIGLNDFGGFTFSTTHHLATPLSWPASILPRPGVSTPRELVIAMQGGAGFTYARVDAAPAPFLPLARIARIVVLPYWFILTLSLAYPILWPLTRRLRAMRKARANRHGLCPTCSYDLRAHAPGTHCPECGTPVAAPVRLLDSAKPANASPAP